MDTPVYRFEPQDYEVVYEPAEDTFLLLDALEDEQDTIKGRQPLLCVEIGPGSGVLISAIAKCFPGGQTHCIAFDINPAACRMTRRTSQLNQVAVDVVNMDLLGGLHSHSVDLLIFNPPYVPTQPIDGSLEEHAETFRSDGGQALIHSWAGGIDGMMVTNRVLNDLDRVLSPVGVFYLLLVKENNPDSILDKVHRQGFLGKTIKERRIRGEHLYVLRIERKPGETKS
ncbi:methyltransferase N6AMT1 [Anopheles ziemanni]|uniref:methyltransferase N6AMT1 n=1 Tax=Anopheles coustani TaxID=139045 RepID=UPI00265A600E|nr:methyltransferase N6AMT1 [Anopheles coustani]XP_058166763.1 methyltransferase N6AMT1 [Anopheles ziemanni]